MHVDKAEFETSAVKFEQYPNDNLPEIALIGRSNVGKSSFINRLVQRNKLARTSSQPGKTQTINFYKINDSFRFVDVPGYGYARVSKQERQKWEKMINNYLTRRENLQMIFILMDSRHEPTKLDQEMYNYIDQLEIPFGIVLTKKDKINNNQLNKNLSQYKKILSLPTLDALFPVSSLTGSGCDEIWEIIENFIF